ncbi:TrpB-like pyridoxal phosphate-dependent enzyme [Nocardioides sp. TF02-7]|uniref:TrpB-like pyridoxal phosphate-dependent enzyme n=1 Tax=Nocardioides sp. TF02-7 TaxID=2917724 RepID=UPI0023DAEC1A|nr:TrpB-like pyridoxal phosphate-dependent enzyme [Nocardioides sp. TF02-7]
MHRSPSRLTESGKAFADDHPGSLGIAISEAVETAAQDPATKYALGSVLNHVLLHQTVIGQEAVLQLAKAGEDSVDLVVGCAGGGSNFAGLAFPFLREKLAGRLSPRVLAVEPSSCPTLTRGEYRYDFGDTAGLTPLMKMHTLGHDFVPSPIHAGGLRYHGMAPLVSHVVDQGLVEATALHQRECFEAAIEFARTQGVVPAPEASHALAQVRREALAAREAGTSPVIVVGLSGHGLLELGAYEAFLAGRLEDDPLSDDDLAEALRGVPAVG